MVEHNDRAALATFFTADPLSATARVTLGDAPAHHARVKRLLPGDAVRITDGLGHIGHGAIAAIHRSALDVMVESVDAVERPSPIHLRVPIGDRERMLWVAEKATELGIATWQAVRFRRSESVSPRGEGPAFAAKVRARMVSALQQSGGGWLPEVMPDTSLENLSLCGGAVAILLDAGGPPVSSIDLTSQHAAAVVLFGPEGGIEPAELDALRRIGWRPVRLAATTLRFDTAGIAAVAVLRASHLPTEI